MRLGVSSQSTICTAINKWWMPFATKHKLPELVPDGDPNRGATAAAFALFMAKEGKLAYGTIQGYIWGWEQHHLNNGRHTPLDNVQDWARWMRALEVQIYVPSEPTLMVPFLLLSRALCKASVMVFWEVRTAVALLQMFYTMSRSEYPVPKTHNGLHNFDGNQHCRRCDVRTINGYVEWAFGTIKQDRLGKRLRGGQREWKPVGDASGVMSMRYWLDHYLAHVNFSSPESEAPFFLREDGQPLLYNDLLTDMRRLFCKVDGVTEEIANKYGLHGIRVLGWNAGRAAMGEEVAALQGDWLSDCRQRYNRETLNKILAMAQAAATRAADAANPLPALPLDEPAPPQGGLESLVFTDTSFEVRSQAQTLLRNRNPPALPDGWSAQEDALLRAKVAQHGCRWTVVASDIPGRSAYAAKNRWKRIRGESQPLAEAPQSRATQPLCSQAMPEAPAAGEAPAPPQTRPEAQTPAVPASTSPFPRLYAVVFNPAHYG